MKTKQQIKEELKQIKYYYIRKTEFEFNSKRIIGNSIVNLVDEYNKYISQAPVMLYDIYISLYTQNCSQACIAEDLGYTPEHISRMNRKLIGYFESCFINEK